MMEEQLSFSEKVLIALRRSKQTKKWLALELKMTRPTLDRRLKNGKWLLCESVKISHWLNIK